jgi:hypothetical protein
MAVGFVMTKFGQPAVSYKNILVKGAKTICSFRTKRVALEESCYNGAGTGGQRLGRLNPNNNTDRFPYEKNNHCFGR